MSRVNTTSGDFQPNPPSPPVPAARSPFGRASHSPSTIRRARPPPGALVAVRPALHPPLALASDQLCLGGHFRVTVQFTDPRSAYSGAARAIPLTGDTGAFWFFDAANLG